MRRLLVLWVLIAAVPALCQFPETDAALEALFAKDLETVSKHLPPELAEAIASAPAAYRPQLESKFLPLRRTDMSGVVLTRSNQFGALVSVDREPAAKDDVEPTHLGDLRLDRRVSDGLDCVLRIEATQYRRTSYFEVWMKYVDSEWRVYELSAPELGLSIRFDDPERASRVRNVAFEENESSAAGSMRSINTAQVAYASTFPEEGFARSLDRLGAATDPKEEPSIRHGGFLDSSLTTPPFVKNGYRFSVQGSERGYTAEARPVRFGETGKQSFFTDESGVIRSTSEDRAATVDDPPLN